MTVRIWMMAALGALMATVATAQSVSLTLPVDPESARISVVVNKGLRSTRALPTNELRAARRAMNARQPVDDDLLRALADHRDGLAAARYAVRLTERGLRENASDIAFYSAIAVGSGRVYALRGMIAAMRQIDPHDEPSARVNQLISVLYPHAWAGNALALDAVIDFNGKERLFGALSESTRAKILAAGAPQDGRIELRLAIDILDGGTLGPKERDRVSGYLERARKSRILAVQVTADNLVALIARRQAEAVNATN